MLLDLILVTLITYVAGNFVGYVVHRLLHCRWMGKAYKDHYHHHYRIYPPNDFLSDAYREPPTGAEQGKYYVMAFVMMCGPLLMWHWVYFLWGAVVAVAVLKLNAWMHDSLHIRGHRLEKYRWFQWLRKVHFQHHLDVGSNFGIFVFYPDRLFFTYKGKADRPVE